MNNYNTFHLSTKIVFGAFLFLATFFLSMTTASAQMPAFPAELEGWAWSGYTNASGDLVGVGWISLSCENDDSCVGATSPGAKVDYGVSIDATGALTGSAWSKNIGWIQFGGLSGIPWAGVNARLVDMGTRYELQGWARACAGTDGGDCSSMTDSTVSGGWDGWISFQGSASDGTPYGVRFNGDSVTDPTYKFAWGGDKVVGWVDFSAVVVAEAPAITNFTANPIENSVGTPTTLEWHIQGFDSCEASNNNGQTDWDSSTVVTSASGVQTATVNAPLGSTQYTLTCYKGTVPFTESVTVESRPNVAIGALSQSGTPVANPDATYDNVTFLVSVTGLADGDSANYDLNVTGATTKTVSGTISQSGGATTFTPPLEIDGLNFGTNTFELEVDLPAPGSIAEDLSSTPQNEDIVDNTFTLANQSFPPVPPTMSITATQGLVRAGEPATIDWAVSTPYVADCTINGAGINESFSTPANLGATASGPRATDPLNSTSVIVLTCTEPITGTDFTEEIRVEVVPNAQEI